MQPQFRILILSKTELSEKALDTVYEWLYLWGAHPMCRPAGQITVTEVALLQEGGLRYDWGRWRDRLRYNWYVVIGADTAQVMSSSCLDGRLAKSGLPCTVLPHPEKVPFLEDRYHVNLEDFVREIFTWARMP